MASTNKTETYRLNQWIKTDPVLMDDFNADNQIIEEALCAKGNCRIETGQYTGKGNCGPQNPTSIDFEIKPQIVYVATQKKVIRFVRPYAFVEGGTASDSLVIWGDRALTWYCTESRENAVAEQCNEKDKTYTYVAIGV